MSFKKVGKAHIHRERSQPEARQRLGFLEKHKDYAARAKAYHSKKQFLQNLMLKASLRNPDEFYCKMISIAKQRNGDKSEQDKEKVKKAKLQDYEFLTSKKQENMKKAEKLQSTFHILPNAKPKHTIFLDDEEEVQNFDAAEYFDTEPELVSRTFNRIRKEDLKKNIFIGNADIETLKQIQMGQNKTKEELNEYQEKTKVIKRIIDHVQSQRNLMKKGKYVKVSEGENGEPPVYKWKKIRSK